jgi:hypothetical protein
LVVGCVAAACAGRQAAPAAPPTPAATEILVVMEGTYERAGSYVDRGTVITVLSGRPVLRAKFQTAFVRGDRLRFEFRDANVKRRSFLVWSDGNHTFSAGSGQPSVVDDGADIAFPLRALAGSLSASSIAIPQLLLPGGSSIVKLREIRLVGADTVDGQPCWHLFGTSSRYERIDLWIDQRSYLLRRTQWFHVIGLRVARVTTSYEPIVNAPVTEALLRPPDLSAGYEKRDEPGFLGMSLDPDSTRVLRIASSGPAERAGLRIGDEIVSIEDEAVATGPDITVKTRALVIGAGAKFVVRRDGVELILRVVPQPWPARGMTDPATPTLDEP